MKKLSDLENMKEDGKFRNKSYVREFALNKFIKNNKE